MILRNATIQYKGYDPDLLSKGSGKRVCCACDQCGRVRWLPKQSYKDLCLSCSHSQENHPLWGKHHTEETKQKISESHKIYNKNNPNSKIGLKNSMYGLKGKNNPNYGSKRTNEQKINISKNHANMKGSNNPSWKGGIAYRRDHVLTESTCIKLNTKFNDSEFHHITRSIGVYIPKELHRHLYHSLKDGTNMGSINLLSLQFINGSL